MGWISGDRKPIFSARTIRVFMATAMRRAVLLCLIISVCGISISTYSQQLVGNNQAKLDACKQETTQCGNLSGRNPTAGGNKSEKLIETDHKDDWYDTFVNHPTDWLLVLFSGLLFFANIALWLTTLGIARETKNNNARQSEEIAAYIRATQDIASNTLENANAGKGAVAGLERFSKAQSRAYLTALVGSGTYQDLTNVGNPVKFSVIPVLINTGHTPAKNVRWRTAASIEDFPLPNNFSFPTKTEWSGNAVINPQIRFDLSSDPIDIVDEEVALQVKLGVGEKRLYMWGEVSYDDIYGDNHTLGFSQFIWFQFLNDEWKVRGVYLAQHQYMN